MSKKLPKIIIPIEGIDTDVSIGRGLTLGAFLDCLRYAGVMDIRDKQITLYPPRWVDPWGWAKLQMGRLPSFGFRPRIEEYETGGRLPKSGPTRTRIVEYEEIKMLTRGLYPQRYCPKTNREELSGVLVGCSGLTEIRIGRGFESPKRGHKVMLLQRDLRGRKHYLMDTGLTERMCTVAAARWCPSNGKVLIGGLGLGAVVLRLAKKSSKIIVCEVDAEVTNLVWGRLTSWCEKQGYPADLGVEKTDIQTHLRMTTELYDFIYLDIWERPEQVKRGDLIKLKELAERRLRRGGRVMVWQERRMKK